MVYAWKLKGLYSQDAQLVGSELERIFATHGSLDPATIVSESVDEAAPLHPLFEWNNDAAAEKYRQHQARQIVRSIVTVSESPSGPVETRAFVRTQVTYEPLNIAMQSQDKVEYLLQRAMMELHDFQRRYDSLEALRPVFAAIDEVTA